MGRASVIFAQGEEATQPGRNSESHRLSVVDWHREEPCRPRVFVVSMVYRDAYSCGSLGKI